MLLFMEPIDTLFFRDNRPFEAGTDTFAESTLASPLAIYGAIGSYILRKNETDIEGFLSGKVSDPVLGSYDEKLDRAQLKVKGIFLGWEDRVYLPAPANLFFVDDYKYWVAVPSSETDFKWDIEVTGLKPLILPEGKCKPVEAYISLEEMREKLMSGREIISLKGIEPADLFLFEPRFGHKIERAASVVEEGFLYSAAHLRFKDKLLGKRYTKLKIIVAVEGTGNVDSEALIFLGGEGKKVGLTFTSQELDLRSEEVLSGIKQRRRFLIYLLTPAIFNEGWRRKEWPAEFQGATLTGAAVRKPVYLSGWRRSKVSQGHPRPIRKAVPQGSVYFFEAEGWDDERFDRLYSAYNFGKSLSEEYPCAGFGISLIGDW